MWSRKDSGQIQHALDGERKQRRVVEHTLQSMRPPALTTGGHSEDLTARDVAYDPFAWVFATDTLQEGEDMFEELPGLMFSSNSDAVSSDFSSGDSSTIPTPEGPIVTGYTIPKSPSPEVVMSFATTAIARNKSATKSKQLFCTDAQLLLNEGSIHQSFKTLPHHREVHRQHDGSKAKCMCPHQDCKRSIGVGFSGRANLLDHLRRVHRGVPSDSNKDNQLDAHDHTHAQTRPWCQFQTLQQKSPLRHNSPDIDPLAARTSYQSVSAKGSSLSEKNVEFISPTALQSPALDSCSSDTDESQDALATTQPRMLLILSKHRLMVRLMQEVYVMFDKRWSIESTSRAESEASGSASSDSGHSHMNLSQNAQRSVQKRRRGREEREGDDQDDDRTRKRRNGKDRSNISKNEKQALACPFFQKDPVRYSCNSLTGVKYRACMGPGFENVSRLKQHLKRVHKAPIQCTRCWTPMESLQAMTKHSNSLVRCERRDPDPQGISQDKMDMINGTWGASWESIFEILFPGAPVLSAYHQHAVPSHPKAMPSSPSSQDLSNFEAYSRTELPRLIEANLQTLVDAEIGPLEENIKSLLVDVVRRCQSTVAQNFGRIVSYAEPYTTQCMEDPSLTTIKGGHDSVVEPTATDFVQSSFEEPPYRHLPASSQSSNTPSDWMTTSVFREPTHPYTLHSDSGYDTYLGDFDCQCGDLHVVGVDGTCGGCGLKSPFLWSLPAPPYEFRH